jgi:hypothetical protein
VSQQQEIINDDSREISLHDLGKAVTSQEMRRAIEDIAAENYSNAPILLEQEYEKNDRVYFHYDAEGRIDGFFMVGWSHVSGVAGSTVFLGLSSVSGRSKGKGIGKSLYSAFFRSVAEYEQTVDLPVLWWFHTATPAVANAFWKLTRNLAPKPDGSYTLSDLHNVNLIKNHFGMASYSCSSHPFVLRGYAKARYALDEAQRIEAFLADGHSEHLLMRLGINERNGDRVLFLGRAPEPFKST